MTPPTHALNDEIIDDLRSILGDGFSAIVEEQVKQAKIYLQEITVHLKAENPEIAMKRAHALKSSCNQVGLSGIASLAKDLEYTCRNDTEKGKSSQEALTLLQKITEHFDSAVTHLREEIASKKS